jgi:lipopolysaccharide/colanic/teichoic acid biosynthesis glycosyltransferase
MGNPIEFGSPAVHLSAFCDFHALLANNPHEASRVLEELLIDPEEMALYLGDLERFARSLVTTDGLRGELRRRILTRGLEGLDAVVLRRLAYDFEALADLHFEIIGTEDSTSYWYRKRLAIESCMDAKAQDPSPAGTPAHSPSEITDLFISSQACSENEPTTPGYPLWKSAMDGVLASVLLILTAPLMLAAMALVCLTSRGAVIYRQARLGRNGRPYTIYKIRTMYRDCERETGPRWAIPGEPRVTPVGRILRATHLDELPQLWNVLRGEMSLVGPRPERPEIAPDLEKVLPCYRDRLIVPPGVTGLAQVQLAPDTDIESVRRKLACDLYYIRRIDAWLDLRIIMGTALGILGIPGKLTCWLLRIPRGEVVEATYRDHMYNMDMLAKTPRSSYQGQIIDSQESNVSGNRVFVLSRDENKRLPR